MRFSLPGQDDVVFLIAHPIRTRGTKDGITTDYQGIETGFILNGESKHTTSISTTAGKDEAKESSTETVVEEEAEEDLAPTSADQVLQDDTPVVEVLQRGSTTLHHRDESDLELERKKYLENSHNGNATDTVVVVSK